MAQDFVFPGRLQRIFLKLSTINTWALQPPFDGSTDDPDATYPVLGSGNTFITHPHHEVTSSLHGFQPSEDFQRAMLGGTDYNIFSVITRGSMLFELEVDANPLTRQVLWPHQGKDFHFVWAPEGWDATEGLQIYKGTVSVNVTRTAPVSGTQRFLVSAALTRGSLKFDNNAMFSVAALTSPTVAKGVFTARRLPTV